MVGAMFVASLIPIECGFEIGDGVSTASSRVAVLAPQGRTTAAAPAPFSGIYEPSEKMQMHLVLGSLLELLWNALKHLRLCVGQVMYC
jgi:hypothetical protein